MADSLSIKIHYFAVLREQRGLAEETIATAAATPGELYAELRGRHGFTLAPEMVRAAVNGGFAPMDRPLVSGDTVVFIPPVAGG
jgi:molybdopterin converting factor subunit 1